MSKYSLSNLEFTIKETLKEIKKHNTYANELENENILLKVEIERLNKELNNYRFRPKTRFRDVIELRDRINKAIEYIENCHGMYRNTIGDIQPMINIKPVLDILKGVGEE